MTYRFWLLSQFKLTTRWNPEDQEEVTDHSKSLWREYKKNTGVAFGRGLRLEDKVPGFLDSIKELHYVQGYSLTDIGIFFGMSRQRVLQHLEKSGFKSRQEKKGALYRVWDDNQNRFISIPHKELIEKLEVIKRNRRETLLLEKRQEQIRVFQEFVRENGRNPTLVELASCLQYREISSVAYFWGYDPHSNKTISFEEAMNSFYEAAGAGTYDRLSYAQKLRWQREKENHQNV